MKNLFRHCEYGTGKHFIKARLKGQEISMDHKEVFGEAFFKKL
ncbi:hypothetical protein [Komagataeibacter europaeus]|nr:hypothetical protein [Komagataeibacter europaeus]